MAAGLAKAMIARRQGCTVGQLRNRGIEVSSAGLFAGEGVRATPLAVRAAKRLGADISRHRSRKLARELIASADTVFCMTDSHIRGVCRIEPGEAGKVRRLQDTGDIPDPIGGDAEVYRMAANRILDALAGCLDREAL